jgi:acetoin utilization deacetylase AcuC-like enzyme
MPSAVTSPLYACDIGPHVFPVVKYRLVRDALIASGDLDPADIVESQMPSRAALERVHLAEYLDDLEQLSWTPHTLYSELPLTREIVDAYRLACDGTTQAARLALEHGAAVHLGGGFHHAFAGHAEGFCYLNDLAVAARALQAEGAVRRIAIVDLDVHQGTGTAAIFAGDDSVFTLSIHQENNYPVPKQRSDLDVGLGDRTRDDEYLEALRAALEAAWRFAPELVLYQAGADPYAEDQLGGLGLTLGGLERRDRELLDEAARRGMPVVVTLGGGYARRLEDTIAIHATTCRVALERLR